jgi:general secretion pathway protein C
MARYLGWVANTVLFVLCCLFAARTVNAVIGSSLASSLEPAVAPTETQLAAAPVSGPGSIEEDLEETKLPLTLLGTLAALEPENSWAAIEDRDSKLTRTVKINDELRPNATVLRIERRRIVIQENGSPRELTLAEDPAVAAAAGAGGVAAVPRPRRPGPAAMRQAAVAPGPPPAPPPDGRNPATLFAQARILPKYENGQMVGVQLNAIKPGSMFEQIGIKNGDVITELNGIKIDSPEQSAKILLEFVDAKTFQVVVQNPQGTQTLTYTPQ